VGSFELAGWLRRIRRIADLSQRQLAVAAEISVSAVAHAEAGTRDLQVTALARAAELAGLRLALLDGEGNEIGPMAPDTVRDLSGRRFPAHLDTRHSDELAGRWEHRVDRPMPWFTVHRDRAGRDVARRRNGVPEDHHPVRPGDSPHERALARRRATARARAEERQRRFLAVEVRDIGDGFTCACPPACDELDDRSGRPVHAEDCPCSCDLA
jgi:transcriptional regulator with XRE-family HTH domain